MVRPEYLIKNVGNYTAGLTWVNSAAVQTKNHVDESGSISYIDI